MLKKNIYLDYAATTPVDPRVLNVMLPYFNKKFGNPASLYNLGQQVDDDLRKSREIIAKFIGAKPSEIIFTSSATESNNLCLKGVAFANREKGRHIIVSQIEHACIMNTSKWLEKQGFEITYLSVDRYGFIDLKEIEKAIKKETILVSVMHANNEIGTIEPIEKIAKICNRKKVYFHTDAAQTLGKIPINVKKSKIDLLTGSSHKMYGPKGAAFLYIKGGTKIEPILHGGGQEFGLRSSTVNIAAIIGFAKAIEIAEKEMKKEGKRIKILRDRLLKGILKTIPDSFLNGHPKIRLDNNLNLWFKGVEGEALLLYLDTYGIACSTGSACASKKLEPSYVLIAIGLKPWQAHSSIRFSLGRWTTEKEINFTLKILAQSIKKLRKISP